MIINLGFFVSKFLRIINRPALRNCKMDKTAKVGTGSNCINVEMDRYSYMGKNNSVCNTKIGAFCSIASYCAIGGGVHSLTAVSTSPVFFKGHNILNQNLALLPTDTEKTVIIENDVWIGEKVFIKDGIKIANGAVIGAHSVVTHDVPPYAIVAGVPARIIRFRFNNEEIEKLLDSKWWNLSEQDLKEKGKMFENVDVFFNGLKE